MIMARWGDKKFQTPCLLFSKKGLRHPPTPKTPLPLFVGAETWWRASLHDAVDVSIFGFEFGPSDFQKWTVKAIFPPLR